MVDEIDDEYAGRRFVYEEVEVYASDRWEETAYNSRTHFLRARPNAKKLPLKWSDFEHDTYVDYDGMGHAMIFRIRQQIICEPDLKELSYLGGGIYGGDNDG